MSTIVTARIDVSTPSGRRVVRELENKKSVKLEYPFPEGISGESCISENDFWQGVENRFNERYGTNYKLK